MSPFGAHEEEREFKVGSLKCLLRRMPGGDFDVDIAPPDFTAGGVSWTPPVATPPQPQEPRRKTGLVIGGFTTALIMILLGVVALKGMRAIGASPWGTPLEITRFTCEEIESKSAYPEFEAIVDVTNRSSRPLTVTGHVTYIGMGRAEVIDYQGKVEPSPLPPDQTGRLRIRAYTPDSQQFGDGQCKLKAFRDENGKIVEYGEAK
ncbi:MAG TPA: hypothetical protein VM733_23045 [Thermoanaerobaculia bacterium]|nr:hypothetical protein [Thermoanaerobaculia bacterium]